MNAQPAGHVVRFSTCVKMNEPELRLVFANWQGDDRGEDKDEVHDHEYGLKLAHDLWPG